MSLVLPLAIVVVVALAVIAVVLTTLIKVPAADQALIITGAKSSTGGPKIVTHGRALVLPFIHRAQYLSLKADKAELQVEGVDNQKIPVGVRGVAIFKVGDGDQMITNAATRFLHDQEAERGLSSQMHDLVQEVFHGHLRAIIGGMTVEDLIANRDELALQTREASKVEMEQLGLMVDSLQIQELIDPTEYIKALGEPRTAEVKMRARIAQAERDREATEAEQENQRKKAAAERDTAVALAQITAQREAADAKAAQAGPLADAEARKQVVVTETEVANLEAEREEKRLDTQVRKPADAQAYRQRVEAEGEREARIALAEAAKTEVTLAAEANARRVELAAAAQAKQVEQMGAAEAKATEAKGTAEGKAIEAKGVAEATAIAKRAEALEKESDAVIGQQLAEKLPEIVEAAAGAFKGVDNLTVLNGAQGIGEIMNQIIGQAGPALKLAKDALGATGGNGKAPQVTAPAGKRVIETPSARADEDGAAAS
jgi:flotillin